MKSSKVAAQPSMTACERVRLRVRRTYIDLGNRRWSNLRADEYTFKMIIQSAEKAGIRFAGEWFLHSEWPESLPLISLSAD
jgi:hypothetical protein